MIIFQTTLEISFLTIKLKLVGQSYSIMLPNHHQVHMKDREENTLADNVSHFAIGKSRAEPLEPLNSLVRLLPTTTCRPHILQLKMSSTLETLEDS